jgi:ABC-type Fe3+/spermidine/putrescine transport system ATPase subunit
VVVMEKGQFRQVGKPITIYKNPCCSFVADFVGTSNFFKGTRTGDQVATGTRTLRVAGNGEGGDGEVFLAIRPEKIEVFKEGEVPAGMEPLNLVPGRIDVVTFLGAAVRLVIHLGDDEVIADVIEKTFEIRGLRQGQDVYLYFPPGAFMAFSAKEAS